MKTKTNTNSDFILEAERILALKIEHRTQSIGGYGAQSQIIYEGHPSGCPSVLVDSRDGATATFMSNGSIGFVIKLPNGMEVKVLDSHFDAVEKREIGVPSTNVWIQTKSRKTLQMTSLMNPGFHVNCPAVKIKIVKVGDPFRAMWFCTHFAPAPGMEFAAAIKFSMRITSSGPILLREIFIRNLGKKVLDANLWTYLSLHGTQRFVYNKELWYDAGYPASLTDLVMTATVPYSDIVQIKRVNSALFNAKAIDATCDYATFVGDTSASVHLPQAVLNGKMLKGGAGRKINRFSTAAIGANQFSVKLTKGKEAAVRQTLLYVTDASIIADFRRNSGYKEPAYRAMVQSFQKASKELLLRTSPALDETRLPKMVDQQHWPDFEVQLPRERAVAEYANSVWTGVKELYENCRAHGAKLADGIELGTRDRGQDMWPKMKEDPSRVRADLVYVFGFMYVTNDGAFPVDRPLNLREKLHGMFPRQYPSQWNNRTLEVKNDNRPYTDSAVWLINSLNMYLRETGDVSILTEIVPTIRLTDPDHPETSGIIGTSKTFRIAEVVREILACFERHTDDSPYGVIQVLYGDWCDPVDMFGTTKVGDAATRGHGRGAQIRLAAHVFNTLIETIDVFEAKRVGMLFQEKNIHINTAKLKAFANRLRQNIVKVAWEDGPKGFSSGFLNFIHEFRLDGSRPDYNKGETGYTLGSYANRDADGINRRDLTVQAFCLEMLNTKRSYLEEIPGKEEIVEKTLGTIDALFYDDKLGLVMFTKPIANNLDSISRIGRMGVLPAGCAENGEYHHAQVFMHYFRLSLPGQADAVWRQFKPMMSALRDTGLAGPFETPCTSYVCDKDDPHFGKGMYFGLSGSVDWIVELFHKIAGLTFALHDDSKPAVIVKPCLPSLLDHELQFKRILHEADGRGGYRKVPLYVKVTREGRGKTILSERFVVNGIEQAKAEISSLEGFQRVNVEIIRCFGK